MKWIRFPYLRRSLLAMPFFLFIALLAVWFLPGFKVSQISIQGNEHVSTDEIMVLLEEPVGKPILKMFVEPLKERLLLHPWVLHADVQVQLPNTLEIQIIEREVLIYLPYYGSFLAVAADGTTLALTNVLPHNSLLFTGVDLPFLALGEKIPHSEFLKDLETLIQKMDSSVRLMISECKLGTDNFFYLQTSDNYQMRVDATIDEQQFLDMRAIILFMREQGKRGTVILQEGVPVFIPVD